MQSDPVTDTSATDTIDTTPRSDTPVDEMPEGFPSPQELDAVDAHLDDVETVLKSLDVDKGLEAQCAELVERGELNDHPALAAYWHAKTEAARRL